jgi:hypothetical protein
LKILRRYSREETVERLKKPGNGTELGEVGFVKR